MWMLVIVWLSNNNIATREYRFATEADCFKAAQKVEKSKELLLHQTDFNDVSAICVQTNAESIKVEEL